MIFFFFGFIFVLISLFSSSSSSSDSSTSCIIFNWQTEPLIIFNSWQNSKKLISYLENLFLIFSSKAFLKIYNKSSSSIWGTSSFVSSIFLFFLLSKLSIYFISENLLFSFFFSLLSSFLLIICSFWFCGSLFSWRIFDILIDKFCKYLLKYLSFNSTFFKSLIILLISSKLFSFLYFSIYL